MLFRDTLENQKRPSSLSLIPALVLALISLAPAASAQEKLSVDQAVSSLLATESQMPWYALPLAVSRTTGALGFGGYVLVYGQSRGLGDDNNIGRSAAMGLVTLGVMRLAHGLTRFDRRQDSVKVLRRLNQNPDIRQRTGRAYLSWRAQQARRDRQIAGTLMMLEGGARLTLGATLLWVQDEPAKRFGWVVSSAGVFRFGLGVFQLLRETEAERVVGRMEGEEAAAEWIPSMERTASGWVGGVTVRF